MKAIRVHQTGGPEVLKLEDVPTRRPGPGQVVGRPCAVGVNPVDTYVRSGRYGQKVFPYTPGADGAGVVESVGDGVRRFKPGDRVYTAGTPHRHLRREDAVANESHVHRLPGTRHASPRRGARRALRHRLPRPAPSRPALPAETVLVHGASGGVGTAAVQLARAHGCVVIGTGGTDTRPPARRRAGRRTTSSTTPRRPTSTN